MGTTVECRPNSKFFWLMKIFEEYAKKYFNANHPNCLKEPILLQLLVEHKRVSDLL